MKKYSFLIWVAILATNNLTARENDFQRDMTHLPNLIFNGIIAEAMESEDDLGRFSCVCKGWNEKIKKGSKIKFAAVLFDKYQSSLKKINSYHLKWVPKWKQIFPLLGIASPEWNPYKTNHQFLQRWDDILKKSPPSRETLEALRLIRFYQNLSIYEKSGGIYAGEGVNGIAEGKGVYILSKYDTYMGDFFDGKEHGKGLRIFNGNNYEGEFKKGKMHGTGVYFFENGDTYIGDFVDDQFCGKGVLFYPDNIIYKGDFSNNDFNGVGVLFYPDGSKYEGTFCQGFQFGEGRYTKPNGTQRKCLNGKKQKQCIIM